MNIKNLEKIWQQVPPDYYFKGTKTNLLQWIWHTQKFRVFKFLINKRNFNHILDIGCADGTFTNKISKIFPKGITIGIDIYPNALNYGKKIYPHIKFILADAHKLSFKTNYFDLVVCYETIEHVLEPKIMLQEIKRVLKKDGIAIITMDSGSLLFKVIWWFWIKGKGKVWQNAHLHPFHHSQLERIIKQSGFKVTNKHFSHIGMEVSFVLKK